MLLTDARWRKALAAARALGRQGIRVLTTDSTRLVAAAVSRYVERHLMLPSPAADARGFVAGLARLAAAEPDLVLLPLEDATLEVVAGARTELAGLRFVIPPDEGLAVALDKHATAAHAATFRIPAPRSALPPSPEHLEPAVAGLAFPLVVKPRRGFGSQGVTMVEHPSALDAAYRRVHAIFPHPVVQERVHSGGDAYGVSCLFNTHGALRAAFVHQRLREYPVAGGPSTLRVSVSRPDLVELSSLFLRSLGWTGFAMVEWKTDPRDGIARLIEVNPRFVGSLELALRSGVDFPTLLYEVATTGDCREVFDYRIGQLCRWLLPGDLMHFVANPERWRLRPSFFQFRAPNLAYDDWADDDPLPSLAQLGVMALQALRPSMWRYLRTRSTRLPP